MKKRPKSGIKSWLRTNAVLVVLGMFVIGLWGAVVYQGIHSKAKGKTQSVPVYFNRAEDAMPFPATLDPAKFQDPAIHEAYKIARQIPGVLAQQPCYCYCQREGHRGLLDCFRSTHAASCSICLKEALLAGRMHHDRKSAEKIRTSIVQGQWENINISPTARSTNK